MDLLFVIPARGGSKGIPHKNIKKLNGRPLIEYSIDVARKLTDDKNICISTDDMEIAKTVEKYGLHVPFIRPGRLASDTATSNDVICHALNYYENKGIRYDSVVLLQPTSPLRTANQVSEAIGLYSEDIDMVVSVKETLASVLLFKENSQGYLEHAFDVTNGIRRQDALKLYEYNGAIYVINRDSIVNKGMAGFTKIKKYVMPERNSIDIDSMLDWKMCETLLLYQ